MDYSAFKCRLIAMIAAVGMIAASGSLYASEPVEWLLQCDQYEEDVKAILEEEGISTDYYYLMVIESRCTPKARSKYGAAGFWQLMPGTSKHYGCTDPDDLECSTRAAARYIRKLQAEFKDFDSVIAAYNMGGHNLRQYGISPSARKLVTAVKRLRRDSLRADDLSKRISEAQREKILEVYEPVADAGGNEKTEAALPLAPPTAAPLPVSAPAVKDPSLNPSPSEIAETAAEEAGE